MAGDRWTHWTIMSNEIGELNSKLETVGDDGYELVTVIQPRERPEAKEPRFVAWLKKRIT